MHCDLSSVSVDRLPRGAACVSTVSDSSWQLADISTCSTASACIPDPEENCAARQVSRNDVVKLILFQAMHVQAGEQRLRDVRWRRLEIAMLIILVVLLNGLLQPVVVLQTRRWFGIYIRTCRQVNGTGGISYAASSTRRATIVCSSCRTC